MANKEQLEILKSGTWNKWREANPDETVDLGGADLRDANLRDANLIRAHLTGAHLAGANLGRAHLTGADLTRADLSYADLRSAKLHRANLRRADLNHANLRGAKLSSANLGRAHLSGADLRDADLSRARLGETGFANIDLRPVSGLKDVRHYGPSSIDQRTLARSKGEIPKSFLRGCGLSDWEIEAAKLHAPNLTTDELTDITYEIHRLKGESPIQVSPLFISYAHSDAAFVEVLEEQLGDKRIRYWRDVHDLKAGPVEHQLERAIELNPTFLLVLSERSVESDWVEWEVEKARKLEKKLGRNVLCPVALDGSWETCSWPGPLRNQIKKYYVIDFSEWENSEGFTEPFKRLIEGLGIHYPGSEPG